MKRDLWGSLFSCLLLSAGLFSLPSLGLDTAAGIFVTAWMGLGLLIALAFLKDLWQRG